MILLYTLWNAKKRVKNGSIGQIWANSRLDACLYDQERIEHRKYVMLLLSIVEENFL